MIRKIGLYILSLWLLFFLIIIITVEVPICFGSDCQFIGFYKLVSENVVPLFCIIFLLIGLFSLYDFYNRLRDATEIPFTITEIENIDYDHLTFLTTYIIPLVCFNFLETRYIIVLLLLIIIIGAIYIRTDLFYANPTLALLQFRIYKINGAFKEGTRENIILISRKKLEVGQRCDYIKMDNRIYYAKIKNV